MSYKGDFNLGSTVRVKFNTRDSTGAASALGSGTVAAYVDGGTTEITAGVTLTASFDSRTGLNQVAVTATSGNGFSAGTDIDLVLTAGTVNGISVSPEIVGSFSLENRPVGLRADAVNTTSVATGAITAAKFAASAITSTVIAADAIGASQLATDAIGSAEISSAAANKVADALLNRDMSAVSDSTARSPLNALRFLRNKWSISAGTLTVTKEDDTTTAFTATLGTTPGADPISSFDP